jgi:hypothetical protein
MPLSVNEIMISDYNMKGLIIYLKLLGALFQEDTNTASSQKSHALKYAPFKPLSLIWSVRLSTRLVFDRWVNADLEK